MGAEASVLTYRSMSRSWISLWYWMRERGQVHLLCFLGAAAVICKGRGRTNACFFGMASGPTGPPPPLLFLLFPRRLSPRCLLPLSHECDTITSVSKPGGAGAQASGC